MDVWKDIKGYNGVYQISNIGQVRKIQKTNIKYMKLIEKPNGYLFIGLRNGSGKKFFHIHRLVAECFVENKYNKKYVNHIDGNKKNNTFENLEWCTAKENSFHARSIGLTNDYGTKSKNSKLTKEQVSEIRNILSQITKEKKSDSFIASKYNVCAETIRRIRLKKSYIYD